MGKSLKSMMLYLISGRSATSNCIGRKIPEVTIVMNQLISTELLCGGDLKGGNGQGSESHKMMSAAEYHAKWYRKNAFINLLTRSVSELKDMFHNYETYKYISQSDKKYDMIWERSSRLHWAGIFYANKHGIPCVLEWKDSLITYRYSLFHCVATRMERWKNKNSDFIIVESQVLKDMLIKEGINGGKIYIAYNAVNPEEFHKNTTQGSIIRHQLGISSNEIVVGYVGSYAFYHDSIRMILAASVMRSRGKNNVRWILIGSGKDEKQCRDLAVKEGLYGKEVLMIPQIDKYLVPQYLSAMDITILPGSTDIICPIKVMEYMAAKSVVLVPDFACNREVINENNGLLFKPFNENSIADALCKVCDDASLREKLAENAYKTVIEHFTWDKTYGDVLKNILDKLERNYSLD